MVRLGWVRSPQSIEVRSGTSWAGTVDVALYTTASVDAVVPAHPEVDWEQLRAVEKGRRSPARRTGEAGRPGLRGCFRLDCPCIQRFSGRRVVVLVLLEMRVESCRSGGVAGEAGSTFCLFHPRTPGFRSRVLPLSPLCAWDQGLHPDPEAVGGRVVAGLRAAKPFEPSDGDKLTAIPGTPGSDDLTNDRLGPTLGRQDKPHSAPSSVILAPSLAALRPRSDETPDVEGPRRSKNTGTFHIRHWTGPVLDPYNGWSAVDAVRAGWWH
jgi:hypothetical protein